jgi:NH3-dependent NAD+ synthetase
MDYKQFIDQQIDHIKQTVGSEKAINALSGGGDSSTVTVLAHRALGDRLKTVFIDSGLMRKDEPHLQKNHPDTRRKPMPLRPNAKTPCHHQIRLTHHRKQQRAANQILAALLLYNLLMPFSGVALLYDIPVCPAAGPVTCRVSSVSSREGP